MGAALPAPPQAPRQVPAGDHRTARGTPARHQRVGGAPDSTRDHPSDVLIQCLQHTTTVAINNYVPDDILHVNSQTMMA